MESKIILTAIKGPVAGQQYSVEGRTVLVVGRKKDCHLVVSDHDPKPRVSRRHCLLDINSPDIRIRDFGSLNGTYVNGKKIGQREKGMSAHEAQSHKFPEFDLKNGDEFRIGPNTFRVTVLVPERCKVCLTVIDGTCVEPHVANSIICKSCIGHSSPKTYLEQPLAGRTCSVCHRDVSHEIGPLRDGEFVCSLCKSDPQRILSDFLNRAGQRNDGGRLFAGYRIVKKLGTGGMGGVFLAEKTSTKQHFAVKLMLPQVAVDDRAVRMFLREADCTKSLSHPNIVRLHEVGCWDGVFFLSLEYCNAGTFETLTEKGILKVPIVNVLELFLQILDGLEYAHSVSLKVKMPNGTSEHARGVVHRDIKPENLFLSKNGSQLVPKIGDYGLAKAFDLAGLSGQTCTGSIGGTPFFMPRIQVLQYKTAKPEVDVWSTTASLYYLLTGQYPRNFPKHRDWWQVILTDNAVPIRHRNPKIPGRIADVIDYALVEEPAIPFQRASDLRNALEKVI